MNWTELVYQLFIAAGVLLPGRYGAVWAWKRWRRGRDVEQQQAQITAAERLQAISLDLVEPIRQELREARQEASEARTETALARRESANLRREMDATLEDWLGWMQRAKAVLEAHDLPVEPLPLRRVQ